MVWRTCVAQSILHFTPVRGLIQKQYFLIEFGEHVLPKIYVFKTPARGLVQKQRFLIWLGGHVLTKVYFSEHQREVSFRNNSF
jgi:hypothetical protein